VPRIAEETIQRVAEANDIIEVIGAYFPLKRAGTSWRALCPFHREKTPSFHVNPQRQTFHCFGCGAGGSVFRFLMDYEHLDFVSAVRKLAQRANIPIIEEAGSPEDDKRHDLRKRLLALHVDAAAWFHHNLLKSPDASRARDYLKSRGITGEVAKSWQLGYAPDSWDAVLDFLREKRFSPEEIAQSGLSTAKDDSADARPYSRFRDRVMFPICNDSGEVIAFSGRVLDPEAKTAKYVNSPETSIFRKGRVFYGFHKSKRALIDAGAAIVCEGQLDLISAFEHGVQNVIAPQGTAFTSEQAQLLSRFVKLVILCFDSDRAGQEAVTRSLPALLKCDMDARVARLPQGQDPDSLIRSEGAPAFQKVIDNAKNFFDYAVDGMVETGAIEDPIKKAAGARKLGPFVAMITDKVLQEATASRISARLQMSIPAFKEHMTVPQETTPEEEVPTVQDQPVEMEEGIRLLCRLAVMNPEVRAWLGKQEHPPLANLGKGGPLLAQIVASPHALEEPAGRTTFASALNRSEELAVDGLDTERLPEQMLEIAQNSWLGMAAAALRNERDAAAAQLRQSGLSADDRNRLQNCVTGVSKQILDLQSRLNDG
jgi:DNA primase